MKIYILFFRQVYDFECVNKQIIIVPIFSDYVDHPIKSHSTVGIIDLKSKRITLLDSLQKQRIKKDYGMAFFTMLRLLNFIYNCR